MIDSVIEMLNNPTGKFTFAVNVLRDLLYLGVLELTEDQKDRVVCAIRAAIQTTNVNFTGCLDLLHSLGVDIHPLLADLFQSGRMAYLDPMWQRRWGVQFQTRLVAGETG